MGAAPPTFSEWVEYCFWNEVRDPVLAAAEAPWDDLAPMTVAGFLAQLFERPGDWADRLSDERVNDGLYLILIASSWTHDAQLPEVPNDLQLRWVRALKVLYRELFARRCSPHLQHIRRVGSPEVGSAINGVCYMIWDLGNPLPPENANLDEPIFDVLEYALSLDSIVCQESALHGLGHLHRENEDRVEAIIDGFLDTHPNLDRDLAGYARNARMGNVL